METPFRADGAKNLVQEFQKYGYPMWMLKVVGFLKFFFSGLLMLSILFPCEMLTRIGSEGMIFLMVAAVGSHIKVGDALSNNGAAIVMLVLSLFIFGVLKFSPETAEKQPDSATQCMGLACIVACTGMVYRSWVNGDYDLDNYDKVDSSAYLQIDA